MRLNVSRIGLLACVVGLANAQEAKATGGGVDVGGSGSSSNGNPVIEFPTEQFATATNVFQSVTASIRPVIVGWTVGPGALAAATGAPTVKQVGLFRIDGRTVATAVPTTTPAPTAPGGTSEAAQSSTTSLGLNPGGGLGGDNRGFSRSSSTTRDLTAPLMMARDDSLFTLPANFSIGQGSVQLELDTSSRTGRLVNNYDVHGLWNNPLYLQVDWVDNSRSGKSYSPLFMVTNSADSSVISGLMSQLQQVSGGNLNGPFKPEEIRPLSSQTGGSTNVPSATASSGAPTASSAESSGGGGLATGAIIGIAVGVGVAALAAIGVAVWFFIRRRRNQRGGVHYPVGYSSDGATDGAAGSRGKWDKEVPMVTTDSPQSRYGPDAASTRLHDHRSSMVASGHHDDDTSYAPYSDRAPTPNALGGAAVAGAVGGAAAAAAASQTELREGATRSPTPPIATRYAHLVEEGMTEDEIRRLEEEERALDAAIEDAGRTSRAT